MEHRREIDGLRALAVLPVILYHAGNKAFQGGFVGVDVFFVISGYLITRIISEQLEADSFSLISFYERRARRILPAMLFMMVACFLMAWMLFIPSDMKALSKSFIAAPLFSSNLLFWREVDYFSPAGTPNPLLHTWSLSLEEQYYIFFPLFVRLAWKRGKRFVVTCLLLLFAVSFILAVWGAYHKPTATFYLLPTRSWELMIGALVAFGSSWRDTRCVSRRIRDFAGWSGLFLILFAVFTYSHSTPFPGLHAMTPTVGAALIIAFADRETTIARVLSHKILVGIGLISYSAYLWHQPLFVFSQHFIGYNSNSFSWLGLCACVFPLAFFTWKYIETPFRSKGFISTTVVWYLAVIGSVVCISIGLLGVGTYGFSSRMPLATASLIHLKESHLVLARDESCPGSDSPNLRVGCVKGNTSVAPRYALFGDSHARSLSWELQRNVGASGHSLIEFTQHGCPPALITQMNKTVSAACASFVSRSLDMLTASSVRTVILSARWSYYLTDSPFDNAEGGVEQTVHERYSAKNLPFTSDLSVRREAILDSYKETIKYLLRGQKQVVLVYPIPEQGWDVPGLAQKRLWKSSATDPNFGVRFDVIERRNRDVEALFDSFASSPKVISVRPQKLLCNTLLSSRCVGFFNGVSYYYDDDHLSNDGAQLVVTDILSKLE